jgi:hypothetical protein
VFEGDFDGGVAGVPLVMEIEAPMP